jgi:CheY-like chemotaxis protein
MIIVFVEDNEDDVWLLKKACENAAISETLHFLQNGAEAVQFITNVLGGTGAAILPEPALFFLDINMPGMNGFEFLTWLKEQPALENTPAVMLTTSENPKDIKTAYKLGANAYLVKSNTLSALSKMLGSALEFWIKHNRFAAR